MLVLIKFIDDVSGYSTDHSSNNWKIEGRDNMIYINKSQVKYIGNADIFRKGGEAVG